MLDIEREIDLAILAFKSWADLDNRMRDLIGSSHDYDKKIVRYSIENQLRYRGNLVRNVINNEYEYYKELLKYSKDHLMLFPYHLSDFIITGMRITPFQYYLSTMTQILEQEKSYDTLPNFTAADCLRLLGIGRNQYIDIMNELRSTYRRFLGIGVKRSARSLLPSKPDKNVPIEPWWFINAGYITEDDVRSMVTLAEKPIIDRLVSPDGLINQILACDLDEAHVRSLYLKGLIYLDVPIYDDDYIVVPPLEGFVMNRVTGDYFETLLYKIFVSIDQTTTVQELAKILEIDIRLVKNAVSMYCRLRFAYKKNIYIDMERCHPSWRDILEKYRHMGINVSQQVTNPSRHLTDFIQELASVENTDHGTEIFDNSPSINFDSLQDHQKQEFPKTLMTPSQSSVLTPSQTSTSNSNAKKIVFFYDSNLAAFLMMGNLSAKLKTHAVTMFEVGKLSDEWIDSLLVELSKIKGDNIEEDGYEAKRYYIHAIMLHRTIEFIRSDLRLASNLLQTDANSGMTSQRVGLDLIRVESLSNLDSESCERFLKKNYQLIISVAPLNQDVKLNSSTSLPHLGPSSALMNSLWFRLYLYFITGQGPPSLLLLQGYRLNRLPAVFSNYETLLINHWNREPTCVSINNALNTINDALTHSPLLVQAYPIQPVGGNLINSEEKVFVPLPIGSNIDQTDLHPDTTMEKSDLDGSNLLKKPDSNNESEQLEQAPAVIKLNQCINLRRLCGYITLLRSSESVKRLIRANESCAMYGNRRKPETLVAPSVDCEIKEGEDQKREWVKEDDFIKGNDDTKPEEFTLFDCHFGVPLFDRFLNKEVRTRISSQNLCEPSS